MDSEGLDSFLVLWNYDGLGALNDRIDIPTPKVIVETSHNIRNIWLVPTRQFLHFEQA